MNVDLRTVLEPAAAAHKLPNLRSAYALLFAASMRSSPSDAC